MQRTLVLLAALTSAAGLRVPLLAPEAAAVTRSPAVSMNFIENMKQMADQRVARVSHIMLKSGTPMPIDEALAKVESWKAEIGSDVEKFEEVAKRDSECEKSAAAGGMLGVFPRGRLGMKWDYEIFKEDVTPGNGEVRGPVMDKEGLHLLYIHTCWEPKGEQAKATKPEWMKKLSPLE